uniref:DNA recombination and repair protein Rad51-like C-terminal domain-containing protein n=1 Tax=Coccidioides posadasii RMSCC 3488 TaxID=454284 RepID=A0A0J6IGX0_COCPO|nr:hypothetical protein CPAG_07388 [Coccidioides posadasii RMSCC 3488]
MGAELFGARLLAEVKEQNLSDILREFRESRGESVVGRILLGIKPLDDILSVLARSNTLPSNPVIEITSPFSADGKTSLLYHIAALAVLPARADDDVHVGGRGAAVIWLDTDGRFDALRVKQVISHIAQERIVSSHGNSDKRDAKKDEVMLRCLVDEALRHIHVFRPQSSASLLTTLESIIEYMFSIRHYSRQRCVYATILDSASAFCWQDWREAEISRIPGARNEGQIHTQHEASSIRQKKDIHVPTEIVSCLRAIQSTFSCLVLYTTAGFYPSRSISPLLGSFKPYLPHPWPTFPTIRLIVRRDVVRPFGEWMTVDEAKADAASRQAVVLSGRFSGWIDPSSIPASIKSELSAKGAFGFRILKEGIEFNS